MTEVVFGPVKPPTTDWRWQEVLDMEPFEAMAELQELDSNLFAARSELREAVRELKELEDTLHKRKQQTLEDVVGTHNQELLDKLFKGGTKGERAQRQETYLVALDWVSESMREIEVASMRKDNAQVAFDSLLDRQTNLGRFANMYAATARLLASIQVSAPSAPLDQELAEHLANLKRMDPKALRVAFDGLAAHLFPAGSSITGDEFATTLYFVAEGKLPINVPCFGSEDIVIAQRKAKEQGYQEVTAAEYKAIAALDDPISGPSDNVWPIFQFAERAKEEIMPPSLRGLCADVRRWMEWHKNLAGSPPVDTAELIARVVAAGVEKREVVAEATALEGESLAEVGRVLAKAYREPALEEDEVMDAMETAGIEVPVPDEHDEGEYGAIEIPDSVSSDEAEAAIKAAIERYRERHHEEEPDDEVISL